MIMIVDWLIINK